jgi:predicted nucleotide-binding protein
VRLRATGLSTKRDVEPVCENWASASQARPNVLFEAGLAFGRHPERTIVVELGHSKRFSDIVGRHTIRITNKGEDRQALANRLTTAGCTVNLDGTDWHSAGDFDGARLPKA